MSGVNSEAIAWNREALPPGPAQDAVIKGITGPITVNGVAFNSVMPPLLLGDEQVAHVLTFVRNSWGNAGDAVTVEEVRAVRAALAKR